MLKIHFYMNEDNVMIAHATYNGLFADEEPSGDGGITYVLYDVPVLVDVNPDGDDGIIVKIDLDYLPIALTDKYMDSVQ